MGNEQTNSKTGKIGVEANLSISPLCDAQISETWLPLLILTCYISLDISSTLDHFSEGFIPSMEATEIQSCHRCCMFSSNGFVGHILFHYKTEEGLLDGFYVF